MIPPILWEDKLPLVLKVFLFYRYFVIYYNPSIIIEYQGENARYELSNLIKININTFKV